MRSYYSAQRKPKTEVKKNTFGETLLCIAGMSFFPLAMVYCFFGILCN